jgi:hypothetical protein
MSVFTRREIQESLNTLSKIVGKKKLNRIVQLLNIAGNESNNKRTLECLATAWEVVILSAFCEIGDTKYEQKISNGKTPDFFFCDHGISLIGDVFMVSDDQQHKKNPAEDFSKIVGKIWREFGPHKGSYSSNIGSVDLDPPQASRPPGDWGPIHLSSKSRIISRGPVVRLALPPLGHLEAYLNEKVRPFFQELRNSPDVPTSLRIDEQFDENITVRFHITYNPEGGTFCSGSYASYDTVTDIDRHVLFRRLMEKSSQFAHATEAFPRILFVCDGGCFAFRNSLGDSSGYGIPEILDHFWRRPSYSEDRGDYWIMETAISAVVVLSIESVNQWESRREFTLTPRLYRNPHSQFPLDDASAKLLSQVVSKLPVPIESPSNAMRLVEQNPNSSRHFEVLRRSENQVEISAIKLLKILAGELSVEEFCHDYRLDCNPFKQALLASQTIKSVSIETAENRDDDKVVIEFRAYDPAIGSFTNPYKNREDIRREENSP